MDTLDTMRTFVAVAKAGSFATAARRLRRSPSVVTRSIAQLEDHLGVVVLSRTTRAVRLTERGRLYLDECERILEHVAAAEHAIRSDGDELRGELAIAAPVMFGRLHVLPVVAELLAKHPALSARMALSDANAHLVDEGIDVAVRIGPLADSAAIATALGAVARVVVASPAYLANRRAPRAPADLQGHDVIAFDGLDSTREWRFADGAAVRVAPRLTVNSADAALAAAEAGVGVARVLSYQAKPAVDAGRLVLLLAAHAPRAIAIHAVYPARRAATPAVTAFIAAARAHLKQARLAPA